jgi:hypothetical protein
MAVDGDDSDVPDLDDLELEEGDDILPVDPASSVTRPSTPPPISPSPTTSPTWIGSFARLPRDCQTLPDNTYSVATPPHTRPKQSNRT